MRKTTTWRPLTHPGVEVDYAWDTEQPEETREHTPTGVRIDGVEQADFVAHYERIREENARYSKIHYVISEHNSELKPTVVHKGDGVFMVHIPNLAVEEHALLTQKLQEAFPDKATLVSSIADTR